MIGVTSTFVPFLFLQLTLYQARANHIQLYDNTGLQVYRAKIKETCTNLGSGVQNAPSAASVTGDLCVYLYEHPSCRGQRLKLQPEAGAKNFWNLTEAENFGNQSGSFKACVSTPDEFVKGRFQLFHHVRFRGLAYEGDVVENCTNLNTKSAGVASSVNTGNSCVYLYEDLDCIGRHLKLEANDPNQKSLLKYNFNDKEFCLTDSLKYYASFQEEDEPEDQGFLTTSAVAKPELGNGFKAEDGKSLQQSNFWIHAGFGVLAGFLVFVAIGVIILYKKYLIVNTAVRSLTPEEVKEFLDGKSGKSNSSDSDGAEFALALPFTKIIAPEAIQTSTEVLGSGNFGTVFKGLFGSDPVAVKTFKRTVDVEEFKMVLAEAKIMAYIGDHPHVVHFVGAEVSRIMDRNIILASELCPHCDLLTYLRKLATARQDTTQYLDLSRSKERNPDLSRLALWCEQIASALEHLQERRVVHGDLATRNVLVFADSLVKIADFGLSKQLYSSTEYHLKRKRSLPWRWCAMETLTRLEFSTESDIWSFGVTAWEIFSLGQTPYGRLQTCPGLIRHLESGNRLAKPEYANDVIYNKLCACWNVERKLRPQFSNLREFFHVEACIQV